jgi:hypothetical protein
MRWTPSLAGESACPTWLQRFRLRLHNPKEFFCDVFCLLLSASS